MQNFKVSKLEHFLPYCKDHESINIFFFVFATEKNEYPKQFMIENKCSKNIFK